MRIYLAISISISISISMMKTNDEDLPSKGVTSPLWPEARVDKAGLRPDDDDDDDDDEEDDEEDEEDEDGT